MNAENLKVLTNIIGAVESGGQVYGRRRYDAYADPYENTPSEHTITLGWAQNYGPEAEKLVSLIYNADPREFSKLDTAQPSISSMLGKDWAGMRWHPNESQKKALISLIASETGKQCQDYLFQTLMEKFVSECEKNYSTDIRVIMMYCEIRHLGGAGPVKRIFDRIDGEITLDKIMASLVKDQKDKSSSNQVGDVIFWTRHLKCKEFIEKYAVEEGGESMSTCTVTKFVTKALSYVGYREKDSKYADMEDFTDNAGSGNYQKFQPLCNAGNGDQWCQYFVNAVAVETCGSIRDAQRLMCDTSGNGYMTGYTPEGSSYFKEAGRWHTIPKVGDIVYFYSSSMGRICHVGVVIDVDESLKTFRTVEGNTNSDGFTTNGGCVAKHSYSYANVGGDNRVNGFGRPRYAEESKGDGYMFTVETVKKGSKGNSVLLLQEILKSRGYYKGDLDKDFGDGTHAAVIAYQSDRIKAGHNIGGADGKPDGVVGSGTWQDLLAL